MKKLLLIAVLLTSTCFAQFGGLGNVGFGGLGSIGFHSVTTGVNKAVSFVEADKSWLQVASNSTLQMGSKDFSIALWIKPSSEHYGIILGKWMVGNREYSLYYNYGTISFATYSTSQSTCSGSGLSANQWWFVVATYTLSDNKLRVSVNNGSQIEVLMTGTITSGSAALTVGYDVPDNVFFNGGIDNLGIWNRVLIPAERTTLYNSGAGINYSDLTTAMKVNLVSWWGFNEASGTRYDSHGTNHLTEQFANIIDATTLNGGFETAGADVFGSWTESGTVTDETSVVYAGSHSALLGDETFVRQSVLTTSKRYSSSLYGRSATGTKLIYVHGGAYENVTLTTSYTQYTTTNWSAGAANFFVYNSGAGGVYIDNVTLIATQILSTNGVP